MKTLLILLLTASTVLASLKWENPLVALKVHPLQGVAPVVFNYSNAGSEPVTITDVVVSCGCLVPQKEFAPIPPGGKGTLKVEFDLFNRTGRQHKTLTVKTSDGKSARLSITAEVPKSYRVSPTLMKFTPNRPTDKTAVLKNETNRPIPLRSVTSSDKTIQAELKCMKEGYEYAVKITALDTNHNHRAVIRITPEAPEGMVEVKSFKFYVFVSTYDPSASK